MPRAAPGESAWVALHRKVPERKGSPVRFRDRRYSRHIYRWEMEDCLHPSGNPMQSWCTFTLDNFGYGVERGCLGEVVSLVGDCRPPPPGNPHRPPFQKQKTAQEWGAGKDHLNFNQRSSYHKLKDTTHGEILLDNSTPFTFNKYSHRQNLKELNRFQYFKINRSFFSCTGKCPVLEFE
jgi:hypothetical protein